MHSDVAIIIPSKLNSVRLYHKPLQLIGNISLIEHVVQQVQLTGLKNIFVALDDQSIADKIAHYDCKAIFTTDNCRCGTDGVYEAFKAIQKDNNFNYIVNVQGDMPFIEPESIITIINNMKSTNCDIVTAAVKVDINIANSNSNSNVKVVVDNHDRALYFSRSIIPFGAREFLYHVGIYGFHKKSLIKFMNLPHSSLELSEKLEQLRALQNNMQIKICYVDNIPISVDTKEDLYKAIEFHKIKNKN